MGSEAWAGGRPQKGCRGDTAEWPLRGAGPGAGAAGRSPGGPGALSPPAEAASMALTSGKRWRAAGPPPPAPHPKAGFLGLVPDTSWAPLGVHRPRSGGPGRGSPPPRDLPAPASCAIPASLPHLGPRNLRKGAWPAGGRPCTADPRRPACVAEDVGGAVPPAAPNAGGGHVPSVPDTGPQLLAFPGSLWPGREWGALLGVPSTARVLGSKGLRPCPVLGLPPPSCRQGPGRRPWEAGLSGAQWYLLSHAPPPLSGLPSQGSARA